MPRCLSLILPDDVYTVTAPTFPEPTSYFA